MRFPRILYLLLLLPLCFFCSGCGDNIYDGGQCTCGEWEPPQFSSKDVPKVLRDYDGLSNERRRNALWGLSELGSQAAPAVPKMILIIQDKHETPENRQMAMRVFEGIGIASSPAVPALTELLSSNKEDLGTRVSACKVLQSIEESSKSAIPALVKLLRDEAQTDGTRNFLQNQNPGELREEAASTIRRLAKYAPEIAPDLVGIVRSSRADPSFGQRSDIDLMWALAQMPSQSEIIAPLFRDLKSNSNGAVRSVAISGLCAMKLDVNEIMPYLIDALKDEDTEVRSEAAEKLGELGPEAAPALNALVEALKDSNDDVITNASWAIADIGTDGKKVWEALVEAFLKGNVYVSRAMVRLDPEKAFPVIEKALDSLSKDGWYSIAWQLNDQGPWTKEAVPVLLKLVRDGDRYEAAEALGKIGPPAKEALPILITKMSHPPNQMSFNGNMEIQASLAVAKIQPEGLPAKTIVPALARVIEDGEPDHLEAVKTLGNIRPIYRESVEVLVQSLSNPYYQEVRDLAAQTLGKLHAESELSVPALIKAMKPGASYTPRYAAEALGQFGSSAKKAVPVLKKAATRSSDADVRKAAFEALKKIGSSD